MAKASMKTLAGPDHEAIATCYITTKRIKGGRGGCRINVKTVDELRNNLHAYHSRCKDAFSLIYEECEFSEPAKEIFRAYILEFLKTNYSILNVKTDNNLLDEQTQNKVNDFLQRNKQLYGYQRKAKMIIIPSYLIHMLSLSISATSLSAMLSLSLLFSCAYYFLYLQLANKVNPRTATMSLFYDACLIAGALSIFENQLAMAASLGCSIVLLSTNYLRDIYIGKALKEYNDSQSSLSTGEIESMQAGFRSQNSFLPHWTIATWQYPQAYYVGRYHSQNSVEEMINKPRMG